MMPGLFFVLVWAGEGGSIFCCLGAMLKHRMKGGTCSDLCPPFASAGDCPLPPPPPTPHSISVLILVLTMIRIIIMIIHYYYYYEYLSIIGHYDF